MVHSPPLICSFCGKTETDDNQVIAGPAVYICFECVEVCAGVMLYRLRAPIRDAVRAVLVRSGDIVPGQMTTDDQP
jgi:ATP-dependent Clp protease ATP-binding subunit ClpX